MPSNALQQLDERLEDVARLLEAHQSGRHWRLEALNRGAVVILSAQLQGYLADLFGEVSDYLLESRPQGRVFESRKVFVDEALRSFGNPSPDRVKSLFRYLGLRDVFTDLEWETLTSKDIRDALEKLIRLRNEIAHGKRPSISKEEVENWTLFVSQFAERFEYSMHEYIRVQTGILPW